MIGSYPNQSGCSTRSTSSPRRRKQPIVRRGTNPPPAARSSWPWSHIERIPTRLCSPPWEERETEGVKEREREREREREQEKARERESMDTKKKREPKEKEKKTQKVSSKHFSELQLALTIHIIIFTLLHNHGPYSPRCHPGSKRWWVPPPQLGFRTKMEPRWPLGKWGPLRWD